MSSVLVRWTHSAGSGIEPQCFVDAGRQQHEQMPHARREINPISVHRIGFNDPCRAFEALQQMRPRLMEFDVVAVRSAGQRCLRDGQG